MFVTSRDTGGRRRNRVYSTNKAARSSTLSLLTLATTSSGDSSSTITQESYNRSQSKPSHRRKRPKEHRSRGHRTQPDHDQASPKAEFFDYLVNNETEKAKSQPKAGPEVEPEMESDSDDGADLAVPDIILHMKEEDPEGYYRSMSDSGISMGSSSSGRSVTECPPRSHLPVLPEEPSSPPASSHQHPSELALVDPRWAWRSLSPGPYPEGFIPPPVPQPPQILYDASIYPPYPYPGYETPSPEPETYLQTPSINIREPSTRNCKPKCFRSFTKISTRLLLQLQDEIAEMEEEVYMLDEESDSADDASERGSSPRDRDIQAGRARRGHLYQELSMKLDQYYRSIKMIQKMDDISRPAVEPELSKHHAWLDSRIFPSSKIPRLAQDDLRSFKNAQSDPSVTPHPPSQFQSLAYTTLINTALPLLMFKLIDGVLNRLILLSIVVVIGASVQNRMQTKVVKEDVTCTILCIWISIFAAICL